MCFCVYHWIWQVPLLPDTVLVISPLVPLVSLMINYKLGNFVMMVWLQLFRLEALILKSLRLSV